MSLFLALVMLVGVALPSVAMAADTEKDGTKLSDYSKAEKDANVSKEKYAKTLNVTLHKMLVTKENIKARKVTVKEGDKTTSKVVIEKEENGKKTYTDGNGTALDANNTVDKAFIDGYASGTPVFGGHEGLDGTKYDGKEIKNTAAYFGKSEEMNDVFFAWQEVGKEKDASQKDQYIKGKKVDGVMTPDLDAQGALQYTTKLDEAFGGFTENKAGITFNTAKLKGQFKIQEIKEKSKYIGKDDKNKPEKSIVDQRAVPVEITLPLVNNDGTVLNAHVYPKNVEDKPQIDKNFYKNHGLKKQEDTQSNINAGADYDNYQKEKAKVSADVGRVIPYEVKTKIAKGTSYEKLIWNDIMTNGLTYNKDLGTSKTYKDLLVKDANNKDATKDVVTGIKAYKKGAGQGGVDEEITLNAKDYTIKEDDKGFRLMFTADGLKKISDVTKPADKNGTAQPAYDVEIQLVYTATVNGSTIVDNPEKNNVTLEYGHKPGKDIEEKDVKPKNKELVVDKSFDPALDEEAKKDLVLAYTLKEGTNEIGTVAITSTDAAGKTFDLGNGIKFQVTGEFKGKFTGLDDNKTYKFSERVAGYNPEYAETNADGTVKITNKKDSDNPPPLNPTEPKVVTGGKKFVKTNDYDKNDANLKRLLGAQFIVKRTVKVDNKDVTEYLVSKADASKIKDQAALVSAEKTYREAVEAYNEAIKTASGANTAEKEKNVKIKLPKEDKLTSTDKTTDWEDVTGKTNISTRIEKLREVYEAAFKTAGTLYEWKTPETGKEGKDIANVVILTSDFEGRFEIQGLAYGEYFLEEIKAPNDFAKIADQKFVVGEGTYKGANTEMEYTPKDAANTGYGQQVKNKKVTIPETGGIGTVIFTVVGISLMAGAFIAMRKRTAEEN